MNMRVFLMTGWLAAAVLGAALPGGATQAAGEKVGEAEHNNPAADDEDIRAKLAEAREQLRAAARQVAELSREIAGRQPIGRRYFYGFDGGFDKPRLGIVAGEDDDGVRVLSVTPQSPADEAGLESGDVIVKLDGQPLAGDNPAARLNDFIARLGALDEGTAVKLTYRRAGAETTVEATPRKLEGFALTLPPLELAPLLEGLSESLPKIDFSAPHPFVYRMHRPGWPWRELELVELDAELGAYFGRDAGILIVEVPEHFGDALQRGDILLNIDGREVRDIDHAFRIFQSYEPDESIHIEVLRHARQIDVTVNAPAAKQPALAGC
mgnify:CR=1 FL=1